MKRDRRRRLTPEQRKHLLALHAEGRSLREIAKALDIALSTARYHVNPEFRADRIARSPRGSSRREAVGTLRTGPVTIAEVRRMEDLYRNYNHTYLDIAIVLQRPYSTVARWLNPKIRERDIQRKRALRCKARTSGGDTTSSPSPPTTDSPTETPSASGTQSISPDSVTP